MPKQTAPWPRSTAWKCPILLLQEGQRLEAFDAMGTPAAYLLDEQGRVAPPRRCRCGSGISPGARGHAAQPKGKRLPGERPLSESRIERHGLKPGTPAPPFRLPDVYGRPVSLEEYRGRRVLLIFTDPHCGPCDQLAPHLVRLHRQHRDNGLALVMIGRGDPEENRRKVEEHGFEFPVALQQRWEISKAYGIFATPVAFLIGEDGVIAREVAIGVEAIIALAQEGLSREGRGVWTHGSMISPAIIGSPMPRRRALKLIGLTVAECCAAFPDLRKLVAKASVSSVDRARAILDFLLPTNRRRW